MWRRNVFLKSATPHPKRARPSVPQMFGIPTYLYGFADGLMKWLPAVQNTACRTSDHRCSTARPHYIACSPAVALASSPPTSSVQAGRANVQSAAPQFLTDDCQLVAAAGRRQLRSSDAVTCLVPRTRTCLGDRAFGVAGPRLWNASPISLRQPHLSLGQFRQALKHIYLTVPAWPSNFVFLGAHYK